MVFFYISYLLIISLFCLPLSFRAKLFIGDGKKSLSMNVSINKLIKLYPFNKDKNKEKQIEKVNKKAKKLSKFKIKFVPNENIFKLIKIYELKIVCHNLSYYAVTLYNIFLALLRQSVFVMRSYDSLYDFAFTETNSADNSPEIQLKLHMKINLFIIFSAIFKIIKIRKRRNDES